MSVPVWGTTLSGPLPVVGLVSLYLTNYLMGRSPLPQPRKFPRKVLSPSSVCGISRPFGLLSPAEGQVSYVLRTRSPLRYIAASPFDLHVLGTPPAFILSQDQTLRRLRPPARASDRHTRLSAGFVFSDALPSIFLLLLAVLSYHDSVVKVLFPRRQKTGALRSLPASAPPFSRMYPIRLSVRSVASLGCVRVRALPRCLTLE